MGNCTGSEDQKNIERLNEINLDKSRRPCKLDEKGNQLVFFEATDSNIRRDNEKAM